MRNGVKNQYDLSSSKCIAYKLMMIIACAKLVFGFGFRMKTLLMV